MKRRTLEVDGELQILRESVAAAVVRETEQQSLIEGHVATVGKLDASLKHSTATLTETRETICVREAELAIMGTKVAAADVKVRELQNSLASLQGTYDESVQTVGVLRTELETQISAVVAKESALAITNETVTELEAYSEETRQQVLKTEAKVRATANELKTCNTDLEEIRRELAERNVQLQVVLFPAPWCIVCYLELLIAIHINKTGGTVGGLFDLHTILLFCLFRLLKLKCQSLNQLSTIETVRSASCKTGNLSFKVWLPRPSRCLRRPALISRQRKNSWIQPRPTWLPYG
jgi:hypothetical protein